jgi:hypothetical protein
LKGKRPADRVVGADGSLNRDATISGAGRWQSEQQDRAMGGATEAGSKFWREHVERQAASSLWVHKYCQQHGLAGPTFYLWRKELRPRDEEKHRSKPVALKQPHHTAGVATRSSSAQFLRVNVPHELAPAACVEIVVLGPLRVLVVMGR